jgi:hypothetical protein
LSIVENKARTAETTPLRNQEDILQLKSRRERELSLIKSELQAAVLELRAVRQEIDRLRTSKH